VSTGDGEAFPREPPCTASLPSMHQVQCLFILRVISVAIRHRSIKDTKQQSLLEMTLKRVMLVLLLLCSVAARDTPVFSRKKNIESFKKWFYQDVTSSLSNILTDIMSAATDEELWHTNTESDLNTLPTITVIENKTSRPTHTPHQKDTPDPPHNPHQNSTRDPPHDQQQSSTTAPPPIRKTTKPKFSHVFNSLKMAMDCVWDPENCDTSIFMDFFRKQFSTCNQHLEWLLSFMRIYIHFPIIFLKFFDHILHTFPKMQAFQTFGLEVGIVAVTFYLWQNFIYYHADQSKLCPAVLFLLLVIQHWCGIALLFIENQEDWKVISSEDSGEVLLCLVYVNHLLNFMLSFKLNQPFVELYLMIMEQTIYCRILGNLSTCSSSLCLCGNLLALGGVVYSKMTLLWKYACRNSTLPGLSTFTFFGSGIWLGETFCVLVKRGYKFGLFPLLYTAGDSSWLGTLCKYASMLMILWEFLSTDLLKLGFGGAAILQVLLSNAW
jgi:hypothetical protein